MRGQNLPTRPNSAVLERLQQSLHHLMADMFNASYNLVSCPAGTGLSSSAAMVGVEAITWCE